MSEYIARERALEILNDIGGCGAEPGSYTAGWDEAINAAYEAIQDEPAADVAPVVHAYWIYQKPYDEYTWRPYICSSCKTHGGKHRTNYCQSCGAKMDLCPPKHDKDGGDTDA